MNRADAACSTDEGHEKSIRNLSQNQKERNPNVDERVILKWMYLKIV
jgi:hypothetical protein